MPATLQITNNLIVTPLIDLESAEFAEQYKLGVRWSMYGDEQGKGPVPASYLVTNLQRYAEADYFGTNDPPIYITWGSFSVCTTAASSRRKRASVAPM